MTTEQKIIKTQVGPLELAKQRQNGSQTCQIMGDSRDNFYRFKERYETGGRGCAPRDLTSETAAEESGRS